MKHEGFTLVEMMASLMIILIFMSLTISIGDMNANIKNDIDLMASGNEIQSLLTFAKQNCASSKKEGTILYKEDKNSFYFFTDYNGLKKTLTLPRDIEVLNRSINLNVTNDGKIKSGITIEIENEKSEIEKISVSVGTDNIRVYSGE